MPKVSDVYNTKHKTVSTTLKGLEIMVHSYIVIRPLQGR
jgi:phosphotransferase system IIA component